MDRQVSQGTFSKRFLERDYGIELRLFPPQKGATLFRSICVCIGQSVLVDEGRIAGLGLAFRVYEAFVILNP